MKWDRPVGDVTVTVVPGKFCRHFRRTLYSCYLWMIDGSFAYGQYFFAVVLLYWLTLLSETFALLACLLAFLEPKFLIAQHNLDEMPPKLFWFDRPTMLQLGGMAAATEDESDKTIRNVGETMTIKDAANKLDLAMQVQDDETTPTSEIGTARSSTGWPVRPTAEAASEFEISPAVHAGYAITWYSLSAAGLYMTRKLVTRGR